MNKILYLNGTDLNIENDFIEIKTNIYPLNSTFINNIRKELRPLFNIKRISFKLSNIGGGNISDVMIHGFTNNVDMMETDWLTTNNIKNKFINRFNYKNILKETNIIKELSKPNYEVTGLEKFFNYIKKIEINGDFFYYFNKNIFDSDFDIYELRKRIIPKNVLDENGKEYKIKKINEIFIIERIRFFTSNDLIQSIEIDPPHPNSYTLDREYCMVPFIKNQNIFDVKPLLIDDLISTYFLQNPHFYPWKFMEVEKEVKCLNY